VHLERINRLVHQRHTVGEKEHALGPVAPHEQVAQSDHRACLACAGRHDDERLPVAVLLERFADPTNGALLIEPLDDPLVHSGVRQPLATGLPLNH